MNETYIKGYQVAGFWVRVVASFIDNVILFIPLFFIYQSLGFSLEENNPQDPIINILIVLGFILMWVYWGGKTPGKALLKIKIISIKPETEQINFFQGLVRYFGYLISTILFFVGFLMVALRKDKRGLHDLMADTCVVYEK